MNRIIVLMVLALMSASGWGAGTKFQETQVQPADAFARNSTAYLNGVLYAAQATDTTFTSTLATARNTTTLMVATSDGTLITGGGVGDANVRPQFVFGDKLYGLEGSTANGRVCYSTDGTTWTRIDYTGTTFDVLFASPSGRIMGWDTGAKKLYRANDVAGTAFTEIVPVRGAFDATTEIAPAWGVAYHGSIMMIAEYGTTNPLDGQYIYKSTDDGVTLTTAFDGDTLTETAGNEITHWHSLGYHAATNRWIACSGDSIARRYYVWSGDDGATWTSFFASGTLNNQPISFADCGDSTYLFYTDDGANQIGKMNVLTGETFIVYDMLSKLNLQNTMFDLKYINGVLYACSGSTDTAYNNMSIIVSNDGTNWIPYYNHPLANGISQCYSAGFLNGKIHFRAVKASATAITKHLPLSPAIFSTVPSVVISPENANLMTAKASSLETAPTDWGNGGGTNTLTRSTTHALHGTTSLKVVIPADSAGGYAVAYNVTAALTEGKTYIGSLSVRGDPVYLLAQLVRNYTAVSTANYSYVDNTWRTIYTEPFTVVAADPLTFGILVQTFPVGVERTIYIDCAQITEAPLKPWYIGAGTQVQDTLTETVTVGKTWTDIFAIKTLGVYTSYANDCTIKTWQFVDADNKVVIAWDFSEKKFTLTRTIAGTPADTISSAATYWQGDAVIKFALTFSPGTCELTIQNGGAVERLTDTSGIAALTEAEIIGTYGTFPMIVCTGWNRAQLLPILATDAEISAAFNLTVPDYVHTGSNKTTIFGGGSGIFGN